MTETSKNQTKEEFKTRLRPFLSEQDVQAAWRGYLFGVCVGLKIPLQIIKNNAERIDAVTTLNEIMVALERADQEVAEFVLDLTKH